MDGLSVMDHRLMDHRNLLRRCCSSKRRNEIIGIS